MENDNHYLHFSRPDDLSLYEPFDDAILFLKGCGLKVKARQETKREIWKLNEVEICIDTWPWLPTFIEIEGPTEESVWRIANKLGFRKDQAKFGSVDTAESKNRPKCRVV